MIPLQMKKEKIPPQSLLQRFHFDFVLLFNFINE